jgi:hypothetical protein
MGMHLYIVKRGGGMGSGCVESIYWSYALCIRLGPEPTKLLYHPKHKNLGGEGASEDKHMPPNPFTGQFLRKADL